MENSLIRNEDLNEEKWISKKELAKFLECDERTIERIIVDLNTDPAIGNEKDDLNSDIAMDIKSHIKKGGYNNREVFYDEILVKAIQLKFMKNIINQGKGSITTKQAIEQIVSNALNNTTPKTLTKEEVKIELSRNKTLQLQSKAQIENSKAQRQIVTEQEKSKREKIRFDKEQVILERKQVEAEILKQKNIKRAISLKEKDYKDLVNKLNKEIENTAQQAEYTKRLKQFDSLGKYIVYIFKDSTKPGQYKIGKTNALGNRLAIGYAENSTLEIIYYKKCLGQNVCDDLEREIHEYLKDRNACNYYTTGSREWFVLSNNELNNLVKKFNFIREKN